MNLNIREIGPDVWYAILNDTIVGIGVDRNAAADNAVTTVLQAYKLEMKRPAPIVAALQNLIDSVADGLHTDLALQQAVTALRAARVS